MNDEDIEDISMDDDSSETEGVTKSASSPDLEARRRLEERLEERRLNKLIQDYDFDDIA